MMVFLVVTALWIQDACTRCEKPFRKGSKFCAECGLKVEARKCGKCGARHEPKDKFCSQCGENLWKDHDYRTGMDYLKRGWFADAVKHLSAALKTSPYNVDAMVGRARALWSLGRREEALKDLSQALQFRPTDPRLYDARAEYLLTTDPAAALRDLFQALALEPDRRTSLLLRARAYRALGERAAAKGTDPSPQLLKALGDVNQLLERVRPALDPDLYLERARIRLAMAEWEDRQGRDVSPPLTRALVDLDQALLLHPSLVPAWLDRGRAWFLVARGRRKKGEEAGTALRRSLSDVSRAIELRPKDVASYRLRAEVRILLGDPKGAMEDLKSALQLDPSDATTKRRLEGLQK